MDKQSWISHTDCGIPQVRVLGLSGLGVGISAAAAGQVERLNRSNPGSTFDEPVHDQYKMQEQSWINSRDCGMCPDCQARSHLGGSG
jgi:hypothetical protein